MPEFLLCSHCFKDFGLVQEAARLGVENDSPCPRCGSRDGLKLDCENLSELARCFFVYGSSMRTEYGGAARVQFNEYHYQDPDFRQRFEGVLDSDAKLIEEALKIGFFSYGPHMWMVGDFDALNKLTDSRTRPKVARTIAAVFPRRELLPSEKFFRLRSNPSEPFSHSQFDTPPAAAKSKLRFNQDMAPIMYSSQDLEICLHECRVAIADELYVAVLRPTKRLLLLDLTREADESTDPKLEHINLAVHMLFRAEDHSYRSSTAIAQAARTARLDGIVYPSYFSQVKSDIIPNLALFGRPIENGSVVVECINRVKLDAVDYAIRFGPVL